MSYPVGIAVPVEVAKLPDALLAAGIHEFTSDDAAQAAGLTLAGARPALARLVSNKQAFSPARGLYIPIPAQYRSWGAVPASWFIDPLMRHLDRRYYVSLLSAAEHHGAAHQRPQRFQVMVDRDVRDRQFGRVRLQFLTNRLVPKLPEQRANTPTGTMAVATPELAAMDLANRPQEGGGLDNVATVVADLALEGRFNMDAFVELVDYMPVAASRRLGWLLDQFTNLDVEALAASVSAGRGEPSKLDPSGPRRGPVDPRWRIRANATVEIET